jgi:hypothetical protein
MSCVKISHKTNGSYRRGGRIGNKFEGVILDWAGKTVDFSCFVPVNVFIKINYMKTVHFQ